MLSVDPALIVRNPAPPLSWKACTTTTTTTPPSTTAKLAAWLAALPGVASVHDVHVWALSTTETALTAHLVMPGGDRGTAFLEDAARGLRREFGIDHATLQVETDDPGHGCALGDAEA